MDSFGLTTKILGGNKVVTNPNWCCNDFSFESLAKMLNNLLTAASVASVKAIASHLQR